MIGAARAIMIALGQRSMLRWLHALTVARCGAVPREWIKDRSLSTTK
jgi:hypothetical protein